MGADLTLPGYLPCHIRAVTAPPSGAVCSVLGPHKGPLHPVMLEAVTPLSQGISHTLLPLPEKGLLT